MVQPGMDSRRLQRQHGALWVATFRGGPESADRPDQVGRHGDRHGLERVHGRRCRGRQPSRA
jgi:hypothetical protein